MENSFAFGYQATRLARVRPYDREVGEKQLRGEKKQPGVIESVHWTAVEVLEAGDPIDHRKGSATQYASQNLERAVENGLPIWRDEQFGRVWDYNPEADETPR